MFILQRGYSINSGTLVGLTFILEFTLLTDFDLELRIWEEMAKKVDKVVEHPKFKST